MRGYAEPLRLLLEDAKVEYEKNELGPKGPFTPPTDAFIVVKKTGLCLLSSFLLSFLYFLSLVFAFFVRLCYMFLLLFYYYYN